MLRLEGVTAGYGQVAVLRGVTLAVPPGQVTCLMGRNGAGKTTTLRAIMGLTPPTGGTITLGGTALHALPAHAIPRHGVAYVPQGRRLFPDLTVAGNLSIGLMTRKRGEPTRERVLTLFPRLRERLDQPARTLSGGEQQMLAIGRALCLDPAVLLLDEPTEGLQPSMAALIRETVARLRAGGTAILLVEQRVDTALALADSIAFMNHGVIAETHPAAALNRGSEPFTKHVGV